MPRALVVLLAPLLVAGCVAHSLVETAWETPAAWEALSDQHRRIADLADGWLDRAVAWRSLAEVAALADARGVAIVGESHERPRLARSLSRLLRDRGMTVLWEEGVIWEGRAGDRTLQGLCSRAWGDAPDGSRRILAGGDRFNRAFAAAAAAGLPAGLVVYAGNAHALHHPELDGPEPRTGGPLPADAAGATGASVTAFAVYGRGGFLESVDQGMAAALMASLNAGRLGLEAARAEAAWCERRLAESQERARGLSAFLVEVAPRRYVVVGDDDHRAWSLWGVSALRILLDDPGAAANLAGGGRVVLLQRARHDGVMGRRSEEVVYQLIPAGGRPPVTVRVGPGT